jgi:hypothetical protein
MGGYLLIFNEPKKKEILQRHIDKNIPFTEAVNVLDIYLNKVEICFICFEKETINYAALMHLENKTTTTRFKFRFDNFFPIPAITFDEIQTNISSDYQDSFRELTQLGNIDQYLSDKMWDAISSTIENLRDETIPGLYELGQYREHLLNPDETDEDRFIAMTEEKDAVGLALSIFGFDRHDRDIIKTGSIPDEPAPFLSTLKVQNQREDSMIIHDATTLDSDWDKIKQYQINVVEFRRKGSGEKLTIVNANRTKIEATLGVDLIYYNHRFSSYVMVQYKRMKGKRGNSVYRPTDDDNFEAEIDRMRQFNKKYADTLSEQELDVYRLSTETFYFKFCSAINFDPLSTALIEGLYLPLNYLEMLLKSSDAKGPKDGISIASNRMKRHLNNTLFIQLQQCSQGLIPLLCW